jgi:hypothetical protein
MLMLMLMLVFACRAVALAKAGARNRILTADYTDFFCSGGLRLPNLIVRRS